MQKLSAGLESFCNLQKAQSPEMAMRGACATLLADCGIDTAPVPLKPILTRLGISIDWTASDKTVLHGTASLSAHVDGLKIHINSKSIKANWRRTRFSVAHEIGHAILYHALRDQRLISTLDETPEFHNRLERVCNAAASELLMPSTILLAALRQQSLLPEGLLRLYDRFLVSRESLLRGIANIIPEGAVLIWKKYARNEFEENRMRLLASYPYEPSSTRPWLPKGCTTKHLTPLLVDEVVAHQELIYEKELVISLNKHSQLCCALATFFPSAPRPKEQQPSFEGLFIQDEPLESPDTIERVVIFAANKTVQSDQFLQKCIDSNR